MGTPMTLSHLTLSDLERSNARSLRFCSLIACKQAELGHKLLLNINRKTYMGTPMTLSIWPCITLQIQGHSDFVALCGRGWFGQENNMDELFCTFQK